jgi:hypothetical protein
MKTTIRNRSLRGFSPAIILFIVLGTAFLGAVSAEARGQMPFTVKKLRQAQLNEARARKAAEIDRVQQGEAKVTTRSVPWEKIRRKQLRTRFSKGPSCR